MPSMWSTYWKILCLSRQPFEALKRAEDGLWFALRFFLLVSLLASAGRLVPLGDILAEPTLAERLDAFAVRLGAIAAPLPRFLADPIDELAGDIAAVAEEARAAQPPLGPRFSRAARLVGGWLATPFVLLAAWIGTILGVWVVTRWIGGQGSLQHHLSLLLLAVAPQVLTFADYLPARINPLDGSPFSVAHALRVIATAWSVLILFRGLTVAHKLTPWQTASIFMLSFLLIFMLVPLLLALLALLVVTVIL